MRVTGETRLRVSAAWASKKLDCTLRGVLTRCHGNCCKLKKYWPPRVGWLKGLEGCEHLTEKGCKWDEVDRPIDCLLYPFYINDNNNIVVHNRAMMPNFPCYPNKNLGPPLIIALESSFVALFGRAQYTRVKQDVLAGKDSFFDLSESLTQARAVEIIMTRLNIAPIPRTSITPEVLEKYQKLLDETVPATEPGEEGQNKKAWWTP